MSLKEDTKELAFLIGEETLDITVDKKRVVAIPIDKLEVILEQFFPNIILEKDED